MKIEKFLNFRYLPRWLVVCMDLFLSFFSVVLSFLLRFNFETQKIDKEVFVRGIIATLCVYLLFFLVFRSFKEIIRHTTFSGILRILFAVASANLFLVVANGLFVDGIRLVPYSVIGINFFISFL